MNLRLNNIYPLIVPADYYAKGVWDLPHYKLPNTSFILTWVVFSSGASMQYLKQDEYQQLMTNDNGWQQISFENLRKSIADHENFFAQYQLSDDKKRLVLIAFMNKDGIGSSRILLSSELQVAFPNGYYLAFPDRSCGLIIAKDISNSEQHKVKDLIKSMYKTATTPMSNQLHIPADLAVPDAWIQPIDVDFSKILINEILKVKADL